MTPFQTTWSANGSMSSYRIEAGPELSVSTAASAYSASAVSLAESGAMCSKRSLAACSRISAASAPRSSQHRVACQSGSPGRDRRVGAHALLDHRDDLLRRGLDRYALAAARRRRSRTASGCPASCPICNALSNRRSPATRSPCMSSQPAVLNVENQFSVGWSSSCAISCSCSSASFARSRSPRSTQV